MPGVLTPALGHPYAKLHGPAPSSGKVLIIYGASSSVGLPTTQIAVATGIKVIAVAGAHNHDVVRSTGASQVFDHKDALVVEKVVEAAQASNLDVIGIFDAVSITDSYARDLIILERLGGGHLATVHPLPAEKVPSNVKTGMIFAVGDVVRPVFEDFVMPALESGKLKTLPAPTVVGRGIGEDEGGR